MKRRIRLGGLLAGLTLIATSGCTISGLPWGDVKVTADKQQMQDFRLSGPTPNAQIADPQQYQGSVKNGTDTYASVRPCNSHYGVTCRDGDIIYLFRDYVYLGYAYLWDGYWWTVPIGNGKSYDYWNHTYVDWTMVDASQVNIEENINVANTFIDQHVDVYQAPNDPSPTPEATAQPTDAAATPSGTPTMASSPTPGATATPTSSAVTGVTLSASSCTSLTLSADGASPSAPLDVSLTVSGTSIYSGTAKSASSSSWTKTFSGTDLRKYAESGQVQISVTAGSYSGTESVDLPSSCAATPTPTPSASSEPSATASKSSSTSSTSSSPRASKATTSKR